MALPRALPSAFNFPGVNQSYEHLHPVFASGAVYIIGVRDDGTNARLGIWSSADPDTTAFTQPDASNDPIVETAYSTFGASRFHSALWLDGTTIHIAVTGLLASGADNAVSYFRFDTAADTWTTGHSAWGTVKATWGGNGDPGSSRTVDIRVHTVSSNEYIQIGYRGALIKVHGVNYARSYISTWDNSSWTVDRAFDDRATADQVDHHFVCLVKAEGVERIHGASVRDGTEIGIHTISTTNGITLVNDSDVAINNTAVGVGLSFDDGTVRCRLFLQEAFADDQLCLFDDAASPSTLSVDATRWGAAGHGNNYLHSAGLNGTDEYWFYVEDSVRDLWYDLNDTADVELRDAVTMVGVYVGQTSYVVGTRRVVGYIMSETTSGDEYDEIFIETVAGAAAFVSPRIQRTTVRM